ncbi:MAG: preprotein translocase subunit SecA [Gemmatales bacterium]|nr:preprotein translocase subunit SecA [Gemmatales bacterium]
MSVATPMVEPAQLPLPEEHTGGNVPGRLGTRWRNWFYRIFGSPEQRRLARAALLLPYIRSWERYYWRSTNEELRQASMRLRGRARGGEKLDRLLPEAFGLVCVAAFRTLGLRPFDVQLAAAVVLHQGGLAEVVTGEGKTLVAAMPAYLNALTGKGVHVTTVNDYLARRDAEWMGAIYRLLGLTVGALQMQMPDEERRHIYRCDITYGTASEFGFDFLRDRLRLREQARQGAVPFWHAWLGDGQASRNPDPRVQREHYYAIVDEADSILIDEARTPLIISTGTQLASPEETAVFQWADHIARQLQWEAHFTFDLRKQKIELTEEGRQFIRWAGFPTGPKIPGLDKLLEHVERALFAHHRYRRDQHYLIEDNKVIIIDEYTGRRMPDRHWREGMHQAVEAKEGVPITKPTEHAAQITYQSYFRLYQKLAGMTGTAYENRRELRRVYKLVTVRVPTNRPVIRKMLPDRVYATEQAKFQAIVEEVKRLHEQGRPVLIGTRTVEKSETLSELLRNVGIPHQVLSARHHEREAEVIAQAGRPGAVTIATNMAGRGTDILLGGNPEYLAWQELRQHFRSRLEVPPEVWRAKVQEVAQRENIAELHRQVVALGGLHVIGTERHDAARIDRQLVGRAGRQGDPGSAQFFLSLEDELLESLGLEQRRKLLAFAQRHPRARLDRFLPFFFRAQRRTERRHYIQRVDLMVYERERQEILKNIGADPYVD